MTTSVRPTQTRFLLALAPATLVVALMLQTLAIMFHSRAPSLTVFGSPRVSLSVFLPPRDARPDAPARSERPETPASNHLDPDRTNQSKTSGPAPADAGQTDTPTTPIETVTDAISHQHQPGVDWYQLAKTASAEYMAHLHADESVRAERWRTSGSVLFEPRDDMPVAVESDLLPDYRFLEPVGVLGIGLTFGQCFVGLPLIGIPVEHRTPVITLVYCRR